MTTQIHSAKWRVWGGERDEVGYRQYKIKWLVLGDYDDGPATVLNTPGLPLPGAPWFFGNDNDPWVWCRPNAVVQIHEEKEGEPNLWWTVEQTFSNKPLEFSEQRCQDLSIDNPLLELPKISGTFVKFMEEATHDRFNRPTCTSSFEQIRGPQNEWDRNRPTVHIELNVPIFHLPTLAQMVDTVNDAPLWGLLPRMIKLSTVTWSRQYYGLCYVYYTLAMDFDINFETFDRIVLDEGSKALDGKWNRLTGYYHLNNINGAPPDPFNPGHFVRFKDRNGENCRTLLNGRGLPAGVTVVGDDPNTSTGTGTTAFKTEVGNILLQKYDESNFLLLGIPLVF